MESILTSIKKILGIAEENSDFDADIVVHINSVLMILTQLGIGPKNGFSIRDDQALWSDFIPDDARLDAVRSYVCLKVRMLFDPPQSSVLLDAIKQNLSEMEWRLTIAAESL